MSLDTSLPLPLNAQNARSPKFGSHSPSSFSSKAQSDQKEADAKLIDNSNLLKDRSAPLSGNSDPLPFPDYKVHPPKPTWGRFFCDVLTVGTWLLATTVAALALNHFCGFNMAAACIGAWVAVSAGVLALSCHCTGHIRMKRTLNNLESQIPRLSVMDGVNQENHAKNVKREEELNAKAKAQNERERRFTESVNAHNEKVKSDNHAFERRRTELEARTSIIDQFIPATLKSPPRPSQDQGSASLAGQNLTEESDQKYVAASPKHLAVPSSPASLSLTPIPTSSVSASPSDLMQSPPPAPFLNKDLDSQSASPPTTGPTLHVAPTLPLPSTPASKDVTSPFVTPEPRLSSSSAMTLAANTDAVAASIVVPSTAEKGYQPLNTYNGLVSAVGRYLSSNSLSTPSITTRASSPPKEEEERKVAHSSASASSVTSTPRSEVTKTDAQTFLDALKGKFVLAGTMFDKIFKAVNEAGSQPEVTKVPGYNKFKLKFDGKVMVKFELKFEGFDSKEALLRFPSKMEILIEVKANDNIILFGTSKNPSEVHIAAQCETAVGFKLASLWMDEGRTIFTAAPNVDRKSLENKIQTKVVKEFSCRANQPAFDKPSFKQAVNGMKVFFDKDGDNNDSVEKELQYVKEVDAKMVSATADKASPTSTPTTNKTQPATTPTPPISLLETQAVITSEDAPPPDMYQ